MRAILILLPVLLGSCATQISQREVLGRARAEVALREPWAEAAMVLVKEQPRYFFSTWKIQAGQMDYSDYPTYEGLDVVPGTERELIFSRSGCLIQYDHRTTRCSGRYQVPTRVPSGK